MFILTEPYVSDLLKSTAQRLDQKILSTPMARLIFAGENKILTRPEYLAVMIHDGELLYTNSENSLEMIISAIPGYPVAHFIELCKDKVSFREAIAPIFPDIFFRRTGLNDLHLIDITAIPLPCIIKPARGFFSLGIHQVTATGNWPLVMKSILEESANLNNEYPRGVVSPDEFIIESLIDGDEYAIDCYFDNCGNPVILNILYHEFAAGDDVRDRLYYTSSCIMEKMLPGVTNLLERIGQATGFKNFPIHLEVRVDRAGRIVPIEANPLRFAGWCVTDIAWHAWGINPYEAFFNNIKPDWPGIIARQQDYTVAMVLGDIPPEVDRTQISAVDFDGFSGEFDEVLELRKIDFLKFPVFAFVFARALNSRIEKLRELLSADFTKYFTYR